MDDLCRDMQGIQQRNALNSQKSTRSRAHPSEVQGGGRH
jgi:hypothetical protein